MRLLFSFLLLLSGTLAQAQVSSRNIFFELGGSGGLGSLNYERAVFYRIKNHTGWDGDNGIPVNMFTLRFGLSFSPIDKNNGVVIVFPMLANVIHGKKSHRLEAGLGLAPSITTKGSWFVRSPVILGYRFCPDQKKIFFRATYTPLVSWLVDFQWEHWFGLSIGYKIS